MAREPMQMNQRPDMPDMAGANMPRQRGDAPVDDRTMNAAQANVKTCRSSRNEVYISL